MSVNLDVCWPLYFFTLLVLLSIVLVSLHGNVLAYKSPFFMHLNIVIYLAVQQNLCFTPPPLEGRLSLTTRKFSGILKLLTVKLIFLLGSHLLFTPTSTRLYCTRNVHWAGGGDLTLGGGIWQHGWVTIIKVIRIIVTTSVCTEIVYFKKLKYHIDISAAIPGYEEQNGTHKIFHIENSVCCNRTCLFLKHAWMKGMSLCCRANFSGRFVVAELVQKRIYCTNLNDCLRNLE